MSSLGTMYSDSVLVVHELLPFRVFNSGIVVIIKCRMIPKSLSKFRDIYCCVIAIATIVKGQQSLVLLFFHTIIS